MSVMGPRHPPVSCLSLLTSHHAFLFPPPNCVCPSLSTLSLGKVAEVGKRCAAQGLRQFSILYGSQFQH